VTLLDHLVRAQQNILRDRDSERLRRLEVDRQLELGGLLDRQIAGLRAFKDLVDVDGSPTVQRNEARRVAHQGASFDKRFRRRHRRYGVFGKQIRDELLLSEDYAVKAQVDRIRAVLDCGGQRALEVLGRAHVNFLQRQSQCLGGALAIAGELDVSRIVGVSEDGDARQ
jgi:hypothetical protein